ncbi:cell division protein FtsQ/DivIB [Stakelama tenebrarum]|uniref:Cell division protein FtsQ n=1 Tax=Stakelama tenebrarum TaxID=2711215 RepID=A0A6G6Y510_9SPHN|nr:cell division protein FtsQ/DivIB [Sphingosinithalassobacter tenebrarum]QIG79808.1 FtsQ-type POTRA domain-containing protein [Sphingosinithalassobacter tenebrarum]
MSKRPTTRKSPARRPQTKRPAQKRRAKKKGPGLLERTVAALPISEATLRRILTWAIVLFVGAVALGIGGWFGIPQKAGVAMAEGVGRAGFRVQQIEITGLKRMDRMSVYAQALDQQSRAMPLVDLDAVRERLIAYSWIEDARVSRRLPDTLAIHIVEREPAAVWQHNRQLMLVDPSGELLEPVARERMPDLPLLIGEGANSEEMARRRLMEAAPALKSMVRAWSWIGNRRWDLLFDTGERLQLPEGEAEAASALARFAELDASQRLLGKGYVGFDLRDPTKLVIRRQSGVSRSETLGLAGRDD